MSKCCVGKIAMYGSLAIAGVALAHRFWFKKPSASNPNQPARYAASVAAGDVRAIDIDQIYNPVSVKDKIVLVTGGNRGLGCAIAKEFIAQGAEVIITTRCDCSMEGAMVIPGIEMCDNDAGNKLAKALKGKKIDIVVHNAGYFYEPVETLSSLNFAEELKMIDICAIGPLRITSGLYTAGLLPKGAKIAFITSQGGSIAWRAVQNPDGQDYGHHMSKAAANMCGVLVSQELKKEGMIVTMLHPGFNKTEMTKKYADIWAIEGAVDPSVGAKRVVFEIDKMDMSSNGLFINCEDGLLIPW